MKKLLWVIILVLVLAVPVSSMEIMQVTGFEWTGMTVEEKTLYLEGVVDGVSMLVQMFIKANMLGPSGLKMGVFGITIDQYIESFDAYYEADGDRLATPVIILIYWQEHAGEE